MSKHTFGCQATYAVGDRVWVKGFPKEGVATVEHIGTSQGDACYSVNCDYGWTHVWPTAADLKPATQRESDKSKAEAQRRQDEQAAGLKAAADARKRYLEQTRQKGGPLLAASTIEEMYQQAAAIPDQEVAGPAFMDALLASTGGVPLSTAAKVDYQDGERARLVVDMGGTIIDNGDLSPKGTGGTVEIDPMYQMFRSIQGTPPLVFHGDDGHTWLVTPTDIEPAP